VSVELVSRVNQQLHGGLAVHDVGPEGAAARAGIQRGDILIGLHQWETLNLDNVVFVLTHPNLASFNPLRFFIIRSGQVHRGWIQQGE
jgi:serine protease Do